MWVERQALLCWTADTAGYAEHNREGAKFVVDDRPLRTRPRNAVGLHPEAVSTIVYCIKGFDAHSPAACAELAQLAKFIPQRPKEHEVYKELARQVQLCNPTLDGAGPAGDEIAGK